MLAVHPLELLRVEHGGFSQQSFLGEELNHLLHRHHFAITAGAPAEQHQEVVHRLRENSEVLIVADRGRAVTLRQFLAVETVDHRKMREAGQCGAERAVEQNLLCVFEM